MQNVLIEAMRPRLLGELVLARKPTTLVADPGPLRDAVAVALAASLASGEVILPGMVPSGCFQTRWLEHAAMERLSFHQILERVCDGARRDAPAIDFRVFRAPLCDELRRREVDAEELLRRRAAWEAANVPETEVWVINDLARAADPGADGVRHLYQRLRHQTAVIIADPGDLDPDLAEVGPVWELVRDPVVPGYGPDGVGFRLRELGGGQGELAWRMVEDGGLIRFKRA